jgi:hypothetical protein
MKYLLSILSLLICSNIFAQAQFTITTANVLGKPKVMAQGEVASSINMVIAAWSAAETKLRNSTISTDGKTYSPVLNKDSIGNNYIAKFKENGLYTEVTIIWNTDNLKDSEIEHTTKLIDAMTTVSAITAPEMPTIKTAASQVDNALEAQTDYEGDDQNNEEVNEVNKEAKLAQTAAERIIVSIDTFMKAQHPEYAKIERYQVTGVDEEERPIFSGEIPLAFQVVPFPAGFSLDYEDNADKIYSLFSRDINSEINADYYYDLYSFTVIEKEGSKYFILIQDYQVRTTVESIKKEMNKKLKKTLQKTLK